MILKNKIKSNKNIIKEYNIKLKSIGKKSAIQIATGFMVMLIIAIVVFVFSMIFLKDFFVKANVLKEGLDEQTKLQIESMLAGDSRVAIPFELRKTKQGNPVSYAIGIKNTATADKFKVQINTKAIFIPINEPDKSYRLRCSEETEILGKGNCYFEDNYYSGNRVITENVITYQIGRNGNLDIPINKDEKNYIVFQPLKNAPSGQYVFSLMICSKAGSYPTTCNTPSTPLYDNQIHKLYLDVS